MECSMYKIAISKDDYKRSNKQAREIHLPRHTPEYVEYFYVEKDNDIVDTLRFINE